MYIATHLDQVVAPVRHTIAGQTFWLSSARCIFWEEKKTLVLSDLHLGKTGHFRKSGIAIPQVLLKEDMQRLLALIQFFRPEEMIVVGDLFHSHSNRELELFRKWRKDLNGLRIVLVKGNHDILSDGWYASSDIELHYPHYLLEPFCFRHDPVGCSEGVVMKQTSPPGRLIKGEATENLDRSLKINQVNPTDIVDKLDRSSRTNQVNPIDVTAASSADKIDQAVENNPKQPHLSPNKILQNNSAKKMYSISGHLHPGVIFRGLGKQSLSFPCFHFGKDQAVLPAFGRFTGHIIIQPQENDEVYAIVREDLIKVKKKYAADRL